MQIQPGKRSNLQIAALPDQQLLQHGARGGGDGHRQVAGPVDINMHEVAERSWQGIVVPVQTDFIAHARRAQLTDTNAGVHDIGKRQRLVIAAAAVDDKPDHVAAMDIEHATCDQERVHGRVEVAVIDDVVDVAVDVVVGPACGHGREMGKGRAGRIAHAVLSSG